VGLSVKIMSQVWDLLDLSQSETLVMLALADHADDYGKCWPSIARVAKKARLQRRATQAVIRRLERKGFLSVDRKGLRDGGSTSHYQLHVGVHEIHPRGARNDTEGCIKRQEGVHVAAPESSLTIKNHQSEEAFKTPPEEKTLSPTGIATLAKLKKLRSVS